jgi:hypothetical protein
MPKSNIPTVVNQIDFKPLTEQLENHAFVPSSGVYFVQPLNIVLNIPTTINLRLVEELEYFAKFNWIQNNVYNLHLPILKIVGFKGIDAIYKVVLGHDIAATAIHLKIPLINAFVLKDEQLSGLNINLVGGAK